MNSPPRVSLVTCMNLPEDDPDEHLLLSTLTRAGIHAELLAWDDPEGNPGDFDLCVLRSCWNYYEDPERFLFWISRAALLSRLANPAGIVRWNIHKSYLQAVERTGVPIVPTAWFTQGESVILNDLMRERGWDDVVIKPSVSAASYRTRRFRLREAADGQRFLVDLLRDRDAMVQRYLPWVEGAGERAVVWIDGEVTHAVAKSPRFENGSEQVSGALSVTSEERSMMTHALSCVGGPLLYARADFMYDGEGGPHLSELELMEPSLFLLQHPPALERLVAAIARWCGTKE